MYAQVVIFRGNVPEYTRVELVEWIRNNTHRRTKLWCPFMGIVVNVRNEDDFLTLLSKTMFHFKMNVDYSPLVLHDPPVLSEKNSAWYQKQIRDRRAQLYAAIIYI